MSLSTNMSVPGMLPSLQHLLPYIPPSLQPFLTLQYPLAPVSSLFHPPHTPILYGKGLRDAYLPVSCAVAFTVLRELTMRYVFAALARRYLGPSAAKDPRTQRLEERRKQHLITRFAEQGWSCLYCTIFWTLGVIVLYQNPNPTSPEQLWGTYPVIYLTGLAKLYYLAQLGWWFHQLYVINTEQRRSDHWQMFSHHILTIVLITGSYAMNFSRVGVLLHTLMDFCDILLPLAKMLRYMGFLLACDIAFVVFLLGWLVSRQIGLALLIRTTYLDVPTTFGKWDPRTGHMSTQTTYYMWLTLLSALYCLASMWFYLACRVAIKVATGQGAEDSRSDDGALEEDEDLEEGEESTRKAPAEKELDSIPPSNGTAPSGAHSTALNGKSPGHARRRS